MYIIAAMKIRLYQEQDRPSIDCLQQKLQQHFANVDSTGESLPYCSLDDAHIYMDQMLKDAKEMNGAVYVAEQNHEIVGFVQGVIIEKKKGDDKTWDLAHSPRKEGWIGLLMVDESKRSGGVGSALLEKIVSIFKEKECDCVRLLVLADNKNSVEFYKKRGFVSHDVEMVKAL